jgi:predicted phosphodiesterase
VIIALLADIHANLEALEACLDHARRHGAEQYVFLGDLVGYNADPVAVVDRVMALTAEGAVVVKGNHDAAASGELGDAMHGAAMTAIRWTASQLRDEQRRFLAELPFSIRDRDSLFVHANAVAPAGWGYILDARSAAASLEVAEANYVFCGHVHDCVLYYMGADDRPKPFSPVSGVPIPVGRHRRWLAIPGSVGQPRDGNRATSYALFDQDRAQLTFFRLGYDFQAAARKVCDAGLPAEFARRLETAH